MGINEKDVSPVKESVINTQGADLVPWSASGSVSHDSSSVAASENLGSSASCPSYVSYGDVYSTSNPHHQPPLFDKYFFYSNRIMKNLGRFRPPQNGRRTLNKEFTLDSLIKKNGGIPEICTAQTTHTRSYRPNWG